ncbi:neoverrucotoxin subunit beta-like [Tachysurus fulvidraco]|uniref:neoverrucotoxin subunit beta-like n=1 Tax=Tachysurus fulvidraco TaxID=1234273 RepID=UPI001FEF3597|nr:neoverrucotoxin subunit beta-like [Tachysurus fulvidraco]XP_047659004.1 neoverrucotoxin subunit beta-like [Tachysurus fulvidraco]XP_047659005.1 neoverrucotoxin subunit beta-like [Tachysurus fulvidraco]XP_047659006.1 neoverrucotoxin subunit beta-like [Tachysurus fulvidraco]
MDSRCMEIAALGRPLYPGMLYDYRNDSFIPGVTLWDKIALRDDIDVHKKPKSHLKFAASDSLSDKANLLDISASLKASFLSGLVEVGGSAKYLQDTRSSARQCRVTMQYSQTTTFEQLTKKDLSNITYPQVFDQKTATHVVTAVLYGAQVFMVFDYTSAENENKKEIERNLHAVVKKIPTISTEGQASLNMTEDEKKMSENISVTLYGDIKLEENPTTYNEALDAYKKMPDLMKQQGKGVPLTVWLYPLNLLDDRAAKLVSEINLNQACKTEHLLEELNEMERICNDLIKRPITDDFPDLKDRLEKFQVLHRNYTNSIQKALCSVLTAIRDGTHKDKALGDILSIHDTSPFNVSIINKWLDDITTELNILSSYTAGLKDLKVVKSSGSLNSICFHPDVDGVVCLTFTSLKYDDSYLAALQDFNKSEEFKMLGKTSERVSILQAAQPWFTSPDISARMRQNLSLFTSFVKANKNAKRIKFIIASIPDPSNPGTSIKLYQNGSLTDPKFQPVSKPPKPVVETSDGKVTLKLSKSPTGETVHFRVEYRMTPSNDSAADDEEWTVIDTSGAQNTFTLTGLKPTEQYCVRYRAVSDVGVSEASNSVPFTIQGKLTVTVEPWNLSVSQLIYNIRTKIMNSPPDIPRPVCNPSEPYLGSIPGGLRPGVALFFQGKIPSHFDRFEINLQNGRKYLHDIAFHFNPCMSCVVLNSCRNGKWENEELPQAGSFFLEAAFDIIMFIKPECYKVLVNGLEYCTFKHRRPLDTVTAIYISGDIFMNTIAIIKVDDVNLKVSVSSPGHI